MTLVAFEQALSSRPVVDASALELHWTDIDHAEGLAFAADGVLWAGGEDGQIYRGLLSEEEPKQVGHTAGRTLGFAIDASGVAYVADETARAVYKIAPSGMVSVVSAGTSARPMRAPNGLAFSPEDVLLVTERTVPDGVAWDVNGRILVSCWSPDAIFLVDLAGRVELLAVDPTRFALNQPTNLAFVPGTNQIVAANIGGRFLSSFEHECHGAETHKPRFGE